MRVELENVSIRFGRRRVFDGLSASFSSRCVTALVGPSGSGKSSLLAAIAGYCTPPGGTVRVATAHGYAAPSPAYASWVAQEPLILAARSALDNVMLGPLGEGAGLTEAADRAAEALSQVGLADRAHDATALLSGGERQRVTVARALASRRPLILADEPSASLDEDNTRVLAGLLARASGRATVIVATHDPVMVAAASAVVTLRGRTL